MSMLTEMVMATLLVNVFGAAAALPFIAAVFANRTP
jgi:hypothetical protein